MVTNPLSAELANLRDELLAEFRAVRQLLNLQNSINMRSSQQITAREIRGQKQDEKIRQLAASLGIVKPTPCAKEVALILQGRHASPPGMEGLVHQLRREECSKSWRNLYRAITGKK